MKLRKLIPIIAALSAASCGGGGSYSPPPVTTPPVDGSIASVAQLAPAGGSMQSANYAMVATVGPSVDNSAATSQHYRMQGGLTGANITLP